MATNPFAKGAAPKSNNPFAQAAPAGGAKPKNMSGSKPQTPVGKMSGGAKGKPMMTKKAGRGC